MSWIGPAIGAGTALATGLFGGGGDDEIQRTKVEYPDWIEDASRNVIRRGKTLADRPYTRYPGERVAPWGPVQRRAFEATQDAAGNWIPAVGAAGALTNQAMALSGPATFNYRPVGVYGQDVVPGNVTPRMWGTEEAERYMNPYIEQALDPAVRDAQIAFTQDILGDRAAAAAEGAFGGSRQAILDQENRRRAETGIGDMLSRGYASAYESALGAFARDANRQLAADVGNVDRATGAAFENLANQYQQASENRLARERAWEMGEGSRLASVRNLLAGGQLYGQLGQLTSSLTGADLSRLWDVGDREQVMRQLRLDQDYTDWLEARDWGSRGLDYLTAAIGGTPYGRGAVRTTVEGPGTNRWGQALGAGLTAWGLSRDFRGTQTPPPNWSNPAPGALNPQNLGAVP